MGRMSREKGKRQERAIASMFRSHFPGATVRRASQAERAFNSDVFIEHDSPLLWRLWLEVTDARKPNVLAKLGQAEGDAFEWGQRNPEQPKRLPVVIWHVTGERTTYATMPMWVLDAIRGFEWSTQMQVEPATMDLKDFVGLLKGATARKEAA